MPTPFSVTHPIGKVPTFSALKELACKHEVQINGNELAGDFLHAKATGKYTFDQNGELRGDFNGHHVLGIITGVFIFMKAKAEITITKKPFMIPEGTLRSALEEKLAEFCAMFPQSLK